MKRNPNVIVTEVGDELVLLHPHTQKMFSLNPTGRVVWSSLEELPMVEIAKLLSQKFAVSQEVAHKDALALVESLRQSDLVHE